ncbi:hypothetical protein [Chryseobacterium daeguense]|uniref:hypothetical protein n=1 Tax=Chryseobacterium daeguense TaxID=412438 RepID=UPI0004285CE7|nr:hypothetical protein [Chryseobacterium daeguense]
MLKVQNCNISELIPRLGGMFCGEKLLVGFLLKLRGTLIDPATFTKTALDQLIREDKLIGMLEFYNVENNDQEPDTQTSVRKEVIETIPGTKGYNFTFNKGNCFQNELQKLHGSDSYEFIPVFDDGSALFAQTKDGKLKGFDCRLFVGIKQLQTSADVAGSILRVYITPNAMSYWQGASGTFESDEFSFKEITPVAGLRIELGALAAAQTTTTAKITNLCSDTIVSGLTTPANWKMSRNGALEAVTAVAESNGNYTFTHAALVAGQEISFQTMVSGYPVYVLDTSYFAGKSIETEVA